MSEGYVKTNLNEKIAEITFFHPKSNSLPGYLLDDLTTAINEISKAGEANVIILRSEGKGAFCAGASFDELLSIKDFETGKKFFAGFANVINAMRKANQFVIARVHGKIVGGGVGLTSASDYAIAHKDAAIRLSELTLSIGPFVIGPAVARKIGTAAYQNLTIDSEWRSAQWGLQTGLYSKVAETIDELDEQVYSLAEKLAKLNPETITDMKKCFWEGTDHWDELLNKRAEISGKLILTDFTKDYIQNFIRARNYNKK